ncbi:MAG TPA: alkaline phosphatase D family protein [Nevskiaceae bacterium]|nr:alkaline phosphatase D family protein [Nevskiaceae bacterium]
MLPVEQTTQGWTWQVSVLEGLKKLPSLPDDVTLYEETIWALPGANRNLQLPAGFPPAASSNDTDWHAQTLPSWADRAQQLAVFHVYGQGASMADPGTGGGSGWSNLAEHRIWQDIGHGQLPSWFKHKLMSEEITRPLLPTPQEPEKYRALQRGIARALEHLNDAGDEDRPVPRTPRSLVPRHEPSVGVERQICLALGSCQYPPGIINQEPGFASWHRLEQRLASGDEPRPSLLVLTGDQVYIDASAGLFDPTQRDDRYGKPYEAWLRNRHVAEVVRRVPVLTMLDDHEIEDNWEPMSEHLSQANWSNEQKRRRGLEGFWRYQRPPPQPDVNSSAFHHTWVALASKDAGLPLFLLDTRSGRKLRDSGSAAAAEMFSPGQLHALQKWLLQEPDLPKIVVCPALLLPRHRNAVRAELLSGSDADSAASLRADAWDGYPASFQRLLQFIVDNHVRRVVFLSGDEHLGIYSEAKVRPLQSSNPADDVAIYTVHSPGLNTPYRFANSLEDDLIATEEFDFTPGGKASTYRCSVKRTDFLAGAGFVVIGIGQAANGTWTLSCEFDVVNVPKTPVHTFSVPLV